MAVALNSASIEQLSFVATERKWTHGGPRIQARDKQLLPIDQWFDEKGKPTARCLVMSGRGFGKTVMGSHWLFRQAALYPGVICHVIAPTYADLRGVIFEGPSGLKNVIPAACVRSFSYSPYPEMTLWNGSVIRGFSSEVPDRLRGPQATFVWGDETSSWYKPDECLSNIDFSTRIAHQKPDGTLVQPQKLYTTTPKPLAWIAKMIKDGVRMVRGSSYENRDNLAADFFHEIEKYEGTEIGRQELHGELLDLTESAIIKKSWLQMWPGDKPVPWLEFVMVSMDTAFTEKTFNTKNFSSDPTVTTVWGVFKHNNRWNLLLLECWERWLTFPDLLTATRKEMKAIYGDREEPLFKPVVGPGFVQRQVKRPDLLVIEDKGSGISLRQVMQNEGIDSYPYNPGNADKLSRLHMVSHIAKAGRIWLPEGRRRDKQTGKLRLTGQFASWTDPLIDQVCVYSGPNTTPHDDWVDSCSQAWRIFADKFVEGLAKRIDPAAEAAAQRGADPDDPRIGPMGIPVLPEDMVHDYRRVEIDDSRGTSRGRGPYD
jgi:Terminase large subunit, T4likevirus-type, N-terminal